MIQMRCAVTLLMIDLILQFAALDPSDSLLTGNAHMMYDNIKVSQRLMYLCEVTQALVPT